MVFKIHFKYLTQNNGQEKIEEGKKLFKLQQVANTDEFLMSFFLSQNRIMMDVELEVNESKLATARVRLCLVLASAEPNQVQFIIQICLKAMFFFDTTANGSIKQPSCSLFST